MSKEQPPDLPKVINFDERKKEIQEKRKKKVDESLGKKTDLYDRVSNLMRDNITAEKHRIRNFFKFLIRDIEHETGKNKWRELESFTKNLSILRSFEDKTDYERAEKLTYQELGVELRESNKEDWETRPKYYMIIFRRINNYLNPEHNDD